MPLNVSIFEEIALLIDPVEMEEFLHLLHPCQIVDASKPLAAPQPLIIDFANAYSQYVENLQKDQPIDPKEAFHARIVVDPSIMIFKPVAGNKWIVDFIRPPIMMKHTCAVMGKDGSLKLNVFGKDRLFLGATFQYPRIYEGGDKIAKKTHGLAEFTAFRDLSRWARQNTFFLKYRSKSIDVRVSKKSIEWVQQLPYLKPLFDSRELSWGI